MRWIGQTILADGRPLDGERRGRGRGAGAPLDDTGLPAPLIGDPGVDHRNVHEAGEVGRAPHEHLVGAVASRIEVGEQDAAGVLRVVAVDAGPADAPLSVRRERAAVLKARTGAEGEPPARVQETSRLERQRAAVGGEDRAGKGA